MKEQDPFKARFSAAKSERATLVDTVGREIYKFFMNGREAEWDTRRAPDTQPEEIFCDTQQTIAEEFTGEAFSTLTPENTPWVEYEAGEAIDEENVDQVTSEIKDFEKRITKSIRSSNYYSEGQVAFQDLVIGNAAIWIDRPAMSRPVVCEAVPLPQVYLRLGPNGIADRFRRQSYYSADLPALFPTADFPKKIADKIEKGGVRSKCEVVWGFWPSYEDPNNPVWGQYIRVDGESIGLDEEIGPVGAVPLVVGRFNAVAGTPWGRGPGWRMLPTVRVYDAVCRMTLEGMDRELDPAIVYPNDGFLDLSDGIEAGLGYPAMPGSAQEIQELGTGRNLDYGFYSQEQLEMQIRDGFYREVQQRGKTPPSATQFMGQEQKQLRRIARPAAVTWREFGVGVLKRFEYLERAAGGTGLIEEGYVNVRPISPLERAQASEDVMTSQALLEMAMNTIGPEQANLLINMPETMTNIRDALKDQLVQFRSEDEVKQLIQAMMQQQGASNGQEAA